VEKPEVILRVSVDGQGRAQTLEVVSGDEKKVSAALAAAKHWAFQPCSEGAECEHTLKFTDYGGASMVKVIE
jgi:outer membrane biosynthesis protein TonB